jgi:hypothetical protein
MRVTFRAQFQGRTGALATPGFTFKNPPVENVEIFRKGTKWFAREATTKHAYKLSDGPTHGTLKDIVTNAFKCQLSKWTMHDTDGKLIDPDSVSEDPEGNFTLKELTHVGLTGPQAQGKSGPNYFNTACGIEVHVRQLRSTRGHNPPDCKICRETWAKTPEQERLKA